MLLGSRAAALLPDGTPEPVARPAMPYDKPQTCPQRCLLRRHSSRTVFKPAHLRRPGPGTSRLQLCSFCNLGGWLLQHAAPGDLKDPPRVLGTLLALDKCAGLVCCTAEASLPGLALGSRPGRAHCAGGRPQPDPQGEGQDLALEEPRLSCGSHFNPLLNTPLG